MARFQMPFAGMLGAILPHTSLTPGDQGMHAGRTPDCILCSTLKVAGLRTVAV